MFSILSYYIEVGLFHIYPKSHVPLVMKKEKNLGCYLRNCMTGNHEAIFYKKQIYRYKFIVFSLLNSTFRTSIDYNEKNSNNNCSISITCM